MRDFYTHQDLAKAQTKKLVLMFAGAVAVLVALTSFAVANVWFVIEYALAGPPNHVLNPWIVTLTGVVTVTGIAAGSCWKAHQLHAGGGVVIAEQVMARLIRDSEQITAHERRLLNVVQELAVSAGIQPPHVCILDQDRTINAFAAGFTPKDTVIGVTRGCVEQLSRDQLQGVIAHEFSHILNGDMLLNMRALIVLHGIFSMDVLGQKLLHLARESWVAADTAEDDITNRMLLSAVAGLAGAGLVVLGSLGTLCGMVISAAISRQREFLADASATELTRNPQGIADALKVVGGFKSGTRVRSTAAIELNHMFFCPAATVFAHIMSSHPPLPDRIRRLDPEWDGVPIFEAEGALERLHAIYDPAMKLVGVPSSDDATSDPEYASPAPTELDAVDAEKLSRIFSDRHESAFLDSLDAHIPGVLLEMSAAPASCHLLICALALSNDSDELARQWSALHDTDSNLIAPLRAIHPAIARLSMDKRLRLFDLACDCWIGDATQHSVEIARVLAAIYESVPPHDMLHWCMRETLRHHVEPGHKAPSSKYGSFKEVESACEVLLSALVYAGQVEGPAAEYAFHRAAVHFEGTDLCLQSSEACDHAALTQSLRELAQLSPRGKRNLLLAISASITADQAIEADEAALVRGICAALHTSVPRLMPGQPVAPGV